MLTYSLLSIINNLNKTMKKIYSKPQMFNCFPSEDLCLEITDESGYEQLSKRREQEEEEEELEELEEFLMSNAEQNPLW